MYKMLRSINPLGAGITLLLFLLILLPLLAVIIQIIYPGFFFGERVYAGLGLLLELFERPLWKASLMNSLILATGTAFLGTFIGGTLAIVRASWKFPLARLLDITVWVLLIMPSFIIAQGWVLFANSNGLINQWLGISWVSDLIFQPAGLILVMSLSKFSLAYLAVQSALEWNVLHYIEAARLNGANAFDALRTVRLPLLLPAFVAGWSLVFMETIGDFGLPTALSTVYRFPTLPYTIYSAINMSPTRFDLAGVLSFYLVVIIILALLVLFLAMRKSRYDFLNNRAIKLQPKRVKWHPFISLINIVFVIVVLGIPIGSSVLVSFMSTMNGGLGLDNLTLQYYIEILSNEPFLASLQNSLKISGVAALCSVVIGFIVSFVIYFTKFHLKGLINMTSLISLAVPGIVLSVGYIFIWNQSWLEKINMNLYGTPAIVVLAAVAGAIPFAVRLQIGAFSSIPESVLQAAALQGASLKEQMYTIVLPFVRSALVISFIASFGTGVFDLAVATMLHPPNYHLLPVTISAAFEQSNYGFSTSATVISGLIVVAIMLMIDKTSSLVFHFKERRKGSFIDE
ncbi:ABC transporter permease [Gracilibacillus saliphilus]|uniref:ABC transporter permease n=1 Tax=Gracilibacillus saliphilus TaxID=543890 RepID=UPI001EE1E797|nr:iron ABC transporter permease [Gracilibacillus saliphilus]